MLAAAGLSLQEAQRRFAELTYIERESDPPSALDPGPQTLQDPNAQEAAGSQSRYQVLPCRGFVGTTILCSKEVGQARPGRELVTIQVTTTPGNGRRSATQPDTEIPLTCGNATLRDAIRRNRYAW